MLFTSTLLFMLPLSLCVFGALNMGLLSSTDLRSVGFAIAISYTLVGVAASLMVRRSQRYATSFVSGNIGFFCILVGALVLMTFSIQVAPSAWDPLNYWFKHAATYYEFLLTGDDGSATVALADKHPLALPALVSILSFILNSSPAITAAVLWAISFSMIAFICSTYVYQETKSTYLRCLVIAVLFSSPLLVNHATLFGYSEIWMALSLTVGTLSAVNSSSVMRVVFAVLLVGCSAFVKNIGFLLPIILISSIAMVRWGTWFWLATMCLVTSIFLVTNMLIFHLVEGSQGFFSFSAGEKWIIKFGIKPLWLNVHDLSLLSEAWLGALFFNSSFSIVPASLVIVSAISFFDQSHKDPIPDNYRIIGLVIFKFSLLCLLLTEFTHYGFTRSQFGSDTLLSRELVVILPLSLTWVLLVGYRRCKGRENAFF